MMATLPLHHNAHFSPPASAVAAAARLVRRGARAYAMQASRREAAVGRMPPLAHRDVMLALARRAEDRLGERLLPSEVPADVTEFSDDEGRALGSVDVRRGAPGSSIDFMLEAWFHRALPAGSSIDITSLIVFLNGATDAPHFLLELIQGGPSTLVVLLDLFPRRDLPMHPDYVDQYYAAAGVDAHRRDLVDGVPQARAYVSPSLLVRSLWSPTAVVAELRCGDEDGGAEKLEEVVRGPLATAAAAVLDVWLDRCAGSRVDMEPAERDALVARDKMISTTSVEVNLSANLPKMFSADVSDRVVAEIRKAFVGS